MDKLPVITPILVPNPVVNEPAKKSGIIRPMNISLQEKKKSNIEPVGIQKPSPKLDSVVQKPIQKETPIKNMPKFNPVYD